MKLFNRLKRGDAARAGSEFWKSNLIYWEFCKQDACQSSLEKNFLDILF